MEKLNEREKEFLDKIKKGDYERNGSFALSQENNIYHGVPFEGAVTIHGEENVIGSMITSEGEKARFKVILIVGTSDEIIMPCGRCRVSIKKYGNSNATILCANKSLTEVEKYNISELYPEPCDEKWLFE